MKEDEDLDALLADLEKPIEKVSKEKKRKGAASGMPHKAEVQAGEDLKISPAAENITGNLFIHFKLRENYMRLTFQVDFRIMHIVKDYFS